MTLGRPDAGAAGERGSGRATRAIIDLDAIAANVAAIRAHLAPRTRFMAVVKANAYGHGATMVARAAIAAGASDLAVATLDEALALRRDGLSVPILTLSPFAPAEVGAAIDGGIALTVATKDGFAAVAAAVRMTSGGPLAVHVKIDTGMRRFGAPPDEALYLARRVAESSGMDLAGIFTHFAEADDPDERRTHEQAACFERCLAALAAAGIRPRIVHAANSAATLRFPRYHYDLVRVGIALYGVAPAPNVSLPSGARPALSIRSRVARVIPLDAGDRVGYGGTHVVEEPGRAALVPIGYGDGYRRALSGRCWMGLAGARARVLGRVSMDQTVVAVPAGVMVAEGDDVVVLGDSRTGAPSVMDLARLSDTIGYEMLTGVAARVPRQYQRAGEAVAVDDDGRD